MGKTGYTIICENCGKESYQTQTQYNRAKHHFCCNDCSIKFRSKKAKCIRQCEYCGKDMELNNSSNQRFCSIDCQNKWQRTLVGESNPRYNRIIKPCESCGKDILMIEGNIKRFKHHFCCDDCRRYWYNNVYSQTEERKEISRINAVKYLESNTIITSTKPQKIINTLLNEMQINFINEYNCTYYAIDNYLYDYNLKKRYQC